MRDWCLIGLGLAALGVLALAPHGCGGGPSGPEVTALNPADRTALEAAASALAEAAENGDTDALDAGINARLPDREAKALRGRLAGLAGKGLLTVASAEGRGRDGAVLTMEGPPGNRTWHFSRTDDGWKLSGA